jgi:lysozyme family protein
MHQFMERIKAMPLDWLRRVLLQTDSTTANEKMQEVADRLDNDDLRFERCVAIVLKHEGGYVDHPSDPGGATNHGISLRYARTLGSMLDLDDDGDVDKHDILLVTPAKAALVYRQWFWADVRGDDLPAGIDLCMFDFAVNSGPSRAIKYAQQVVRVEADGFIGPVTMAALQKADPRSFIMHYQEDRESFLRSLRNPKTGLLQWNTFGRGWKHRVDDVKQAALAMV